MLPFPQQVTTVILPSEVQPIHTKRLILRTLQDGDAPGIFAIRSRPETVNFLFPKIPESSIEQTRAWMTKKIITDPDASGATGRHFEFVLIQKGDLEEQIVGVVGVNGLLPAPSVGYGVHPDFWGRGYAGEALQGLIKAWWELPRKDNIVQDDGVKEKLYAASNCDNVGSIKVLQKNGFQIYDKVPMEGETVAMMYLEKPE